MIANNNDANQASIHGRIASDPIKQALANAMALYGGGLSAVIGGDVPYSDHAPFEAAGLQACLLIEYNYGNNSYYHQAGDSVDTTNYIDYTYATRMTQSTVGYLADAASAVPEPSSLLLVGGSCLLLVRVLSNKKQERP
jgi:predicted TIM-barrel enzyme